ncbi:MAG: PRC-barrel domain-containing protein [Rubrobacteraceae bacterium]
MQKVNELFEKDVVAQSSGEKLAKVRDLVFDGEASRLVAMLIAGSTPFGGTQVVRWNMVVSTGDVVVVTGEDLPNLGDEPEVDALHRSGRHITGTDIVTEEGEKVGAVGDIFVDDRGVVVGYEVKQGLLSSNKFLPVEKVRSAGKDAIIAIDADLSSVKDVENGRG